MTDLGCTFERWDGKGTPGSVSGEALPRPVQVVQVAEAVEAFARDGGAELASTMVRRRSGTVLSPPMVEAFHRAAPDLLDTLESPDPWTAILAAEPLPWLDVDEDGLDGVLEVFADFTDLRSVHFGGHSRAVAALAADAAEVAGCSSADVVAVRRAGLVHDIGRVATSAGVWGKRGPLTRAEREAVQLHPYLTERVLARPEWIRDIGRLASLHHERLDGSGYFRGCHGVDQPRTARLLATADVLRSKLERRPHREALTLSQAADHLRGEVRSGRLDADVADAVLAAAGEAPRRRRRAGRELTPREVDIVRLLARGESKPQIARLLVVSVKTVDAHVQHIYTKLDVSSRAGLTLYAMQQGLLDPLLESD